MGSRRTSAEAVYKAAETWVEGALRSDDSLFTPGKHIWTSQWLDEVHRRFLNQPNKGEGKFYERLEEQLKGSPPEVYQLMGEALYVHFLISSSMKSETKRNGIDEVLGWSESPVTIPDDVTGLTPGLVNPGLGFAQYRAYHVGFLVEFVEQWKKQEPGKGNRLLANPWAFKDFVMSLTLQSQTLRDRRNTPHAQKEALLHLVFPDTFEAIISKKHKEQISETFAHLVSKPTEDVDLKLAQIRTSLEAKYGSFDFYQKEIKEQWTNQKPEDEDAVAVNPPPGSALRDLADELLLPVEFLREIRTLLYEKKQVIFQGPPGTGKTYVAQRLARHIAGSRGLVTFVQFHPSYSYEDFVQGFRPTQAGNGQPGFKLRNGPLLQAAERARNAPGAKHFLIIDEINRGNLAKVLGELYFLLEYRGEQMSLQYSDELFSLPDNLYVIGTMNTADRSIALVDLALRRRFYFVEFHPGKEPVEGLLRRWLEKNASGMEWVSDVVDRANERLKNDRDAAIGPSYFMKKGLDEDAVSRIWKHSVKPYIEERLFGDAERLDEFDLEKLRRGTTSAQDNDA